MAYIKKTIDIKKLLIDMLTSLKILKSKPSFIPKTGYNVANSDSIEFENGLIIKYGSAQGAGGTAGTTTAAGCCQQVTFPTAFPNNCFFVLTGVGGYNIDGGKTPNTYSSYVTSDVTRTGFKATVNGINYAQSSNNTYYSTTYITYIAIGN